MTLPTVAEKKAPARASVAALAPPVRPTARGDPAANASAAPAAELVTSLATAAGSESELSPIRNLALAPRTTDPLTFPGVAVTSARTMAADLSLLFLPIARAMAPPLSLPLSLRLAARSEQSCPGRPRLTSTSQRQLLLGMRKKVVVLQAGQEL